MSTDTLQDDLARAGDLLRTLVLSSLESGPVETRAKISSAYGGFEKAMGEPRGMPGREARAWKSAFFTLLHVHSAKMDDCLQTLTR